MPTRAEVPGAKQDSAKRLFMETEGSLRRASVPNDLASGVAVPIGRSLHCRAALVHKISGASAETVWNRGTGHGGGGISHMALSAPVPARGLRDGRRPRFGELREGGVMTSYVPEIGQDGSKADLACRTVQPARRRSACRLARACSDRASTHHRLRSGPGAGAAAGRRGLDQQGVADLAGGPRPHRQGSPTGSVEGLSLVDLPLHYQEAVPPRTTRSP